MSRVIGRSVADVVERLELDADRVVTTERLTAVLRELGSVTDPRVVAYELQRDGWLGHLRTRHAWEFLPAARGGPYGSGDRFVEFRAKLEVHPDWGGVLAMESAASVLGLAQRLPEKEVVALPHGESFPKAFAGDWREIRIDLPASGRTVVNDLPTWSVDGLLVGVAVRPSAYRDVAGLAQWLPEASTRVDVDNVITLLEPFDGPARQRVAYLLTVMDNSTAADQVVAVYPPKSLSWLGPRRTGGAFDHRSNVNDTLLRPYLSAGTGA